MPSLMQDTIGLFVILGFVVLLIAGFSKKTVKEVLDQIKEILFGGKEDE